MGTDLPSQEPEAPAQKRGGAQCLVLRDEWRNACKYRCQARDGYYSKRCLLASMSRRYYGCSSAIRPTVEMIQLHKLGRNKIRLYGPLHQYFGQIVAALKHRKWPFRLMMSPWRGVYPAVCISNKISFSKPSVKPLETSFKTSSGNDWLSILVDYLPSRMSPIETQ
jgi:hypothetical protein